MSDTTGKTVPSDNYYLFKSCVTGSLYPGIEKSIRFVMDRLNVRYTDDPRHSSCTGFGYHTGVVPLMTNLSLNARNFSLAATARDKNIVCTCPTSYGNLKECKEMLLSDTEKHDQVAKVLESVGRSYDMTPQVYHASEVFLARLSDIEKRAIYSFKGIRAVTHHGCHYAKIFYKDVSSGSFERPIVLDKIATGLGCEVVDYEERSLCCGMGFHYTLLDREYPRTVLRRKFAAIKKAKPDVIITQCPGCTFNLDYYQETLAEQVGTLDIPVLYFSELAALALGADPYEIGLDMHAVSVEPFLEKAGIPGGRK